MKQWSSAKTLVVITITLVALSILSTVPVLYMAKAQDQALVISPPQGPPGTFITVIGMGFSANTRVSLSLGGTDVASAYVGSMFGRFSTSFAVPNLPLGTYTITAKDEVGHTATASFSVITKSSTPVPSKANPSSSPGTSSKATPTEGTWVYPTKKPTATPTVGSAEFWSPTTIAVVAIVAIAAILIPSILLIRRGGKKELPIEGESPLQRPSTTPPPRAPVPPLPYQTAYSRSAHYGQTTSGYSSVSRYGQPSSYSQQLSRQAGARYNQPQSYQRTAFTKICPQCRRVVRDDYNLCPYCDKRLK